jgi:predicted nucleotidyltransferase
MESLRRVATELGIPERTLRRAATEGLIRGERTSPRRFEVPLREEAYLRTHWPLLSALRAALRTEPNVRLAVLFGPSANGTEDERSDVDLLVTLSDSNVGRLADLTQRVTERIGRDVLTTGLSEAREVPALMLDVIEQGRVLVDREDRWSTLQAGKRRWRRKASEAERSPVTALAEHEPGGDPA